MMTTKVDEIAPHIYRLSTLVAEIGPSGFTAEFPPGSSGLQAHAAGDHRLPPHRERDSERKRHA